MEIRTHRARRLIAHPPTVRRVACVALVGAVLTLTSGGVCYARGAGGTDRPVANPNHVLGAKLFDQCIRWVAKGSSGVGKARDFYVKLDAELELESTRHKGPMRIWWKGNDKYRQELTTSGRTTTKILNINRTLKPPMSYMWIIQPTGRVRRMHGTPEGARAIAQLRDDATRLGDLAQFITLEELKGPRVIFEYEGTTRGTGTFSSKASPSGLWAKVVRKMPGNANIRFWMAFSKDAAGNMTAMWPGVVKVDGSAKEKYPDEYYILKQWRDSPPERPRAMRYPRKIEAYSTMPGSGQQPAPFLKADVLDIKINMGIDASLFMPPKRK